MVRRALRARDSTLPAARTATVPAPVGGRNTRDDLAAMPETDAEILDNWFPEGSYVRPRRGVNNHKGVLPGQIESILSYANGATLKLFAACSGTMQDITTAGTTASNSTATSMTGLTNNRWQYVNFGAAGVNVLACVNGADAPRQYDGATWAAMTFASTSIGTATSSQFIGVMEHKQRLFFIQDDTLKFWYMGNTNSYSGTVTSFDLSSLMQMGGELMCLGSWTRDGGAGMDDYAVFVSDRGEAAVFAGTDPGNSSNWTLEGVYRIPAPLSRRSMQKLGGDLLILTELGVLPFSMALSGREPQALLTDKIRDTVADDVSVYRANFGWELKFFPAGHQLFINVPVTAGAYQKQHVMNTGTGAWGSYGEIASRIEANCWEVHNNQLLYGGNTFVRRAETGTNDYGADIQCELKQASSHFGLPGQLKKFNLMRCHMRSDGELPFAFGLNIDFSDVPPSSIPTPTAISWPEWDVATWDDFYWGDNPRPVGTWQAANGLGTYAALRIKGAVNSETIQFIATDYVYEPAGLF